MTENNYMSWVSLIPKNEGYYNIMSRPSYNCNALMRYAIFQERSQPVAGGEAHNLVHSSQCACAELRKRQLDPEIANFTIEWALAQRIRVGGSAPPSPPPCPPISACQSYINSDNCIYLRENLSSVVLYYTAQDRCTPKGNVECKC